MSSQIGHYEVQAEIGRGAFTRVFRAWDPGAKRPAAIKVPVEISERDLFLYLQREAAILKGLKHPNIVTIYEWGEQQETPFIAVEYLEGETLRRAISNRKALAVRDKMEILAQVAEALDSTHRVGGAHLDLRPENIMLLPNRRVKLLDFGSVELTDECAARLSREGYLSASILYATPEQLNSTEVVDTLNDVFVYGVLYYELLTGKHPFQAGDEKEVIANIVNADPHPVRTIAPECPRALERILKRALNKDPNLRFQSIGALQAEIAPLLVAMRREREPETAKPAVAAAAPEVSRVQTKPPQPAKKPAQPAAGATPVEAIPDPAAPSVLAVAPVWKRRAMMALPALALVAAAGVVVPKLSQKGAMPTTPVANAAANSVQPALPQAETPQPQPATAAPTSPIEQDRPSAFGTPGQPGGAPDAGKTAATEQPAPEPPPPTRQELDPSLLVRPKQAPAAILKSDDLPAPPPALPAGAPALPSALPTVARVAAPAPAPVPPPTPTKESVRVGGNFQNAKLLSGPQPQMPPLAKERRVYGAVKLEATISKEGVVKDVSVVSGHPFLVLAAKEAALKRRYQPATLNGEPMEVKVPIQIVFQPSQ